jgi:acyl carrier protein
MEPEDIDERVRRIVAETIEAVPGTVTATASFDGLKMDSLAAVEVALAIEEEFKIEIPDEALSPDSGITSIPELCQYVRTRLRDQE